MDMAGSPGTSHAGRGIRVGSTGRTIPETTRPGRWARAGVGREECGDDAGSDLSKRLRTDDPAGRYHDRLRRWRQDGDGEGDADGAGVGDGAVDPEAAGEEDGAADPDAEPPPMAAAALAASVASDVSMSKSASE